MISKKSLAVFLSKLRVFENPDMRLEQYATDSDIAAEIIWAAYMNQDVEDKVIVDFGCGTGILGIGALLMAAKKVYFVDIDPKAIELLRSNLKFLNERVEGELDYEIINTAIESFDKKVDVVIQNPPFGTKVEHSDRVFLTKAFATADKIYSFHKSTTASFVDAISKDNHFKITAEYKLKFPLKNTMKFHKQKVERIDVTCFRIEKSV